MLKPIYSLFPELVFEKKAHGQWDKVMLLPAPLLSCVFHLLLELDHF